MTLAFEPGQLIYENQLAESLSVSRTPVREAIRSLVNECLLEVLPQRGTRVAYISVKKVLEARFIRSLLEQGAFRIAAAEWSAEKKTVSNKAIQRMLEEQREAAADGDITVFLQLDEAFHRVIMEEAGNATLLNVVYQMRGHLNRLRYMALRQYRHMPQIVEEHERLFEAIAANDSELAGRLLELHFGKLNDEMSELRALTPHYFID